MRIILQRQLIAFAILFIFNIFPVQALEHPDVEFKIFQFPHNMIPRIDGNTDDWDIVPDDYIIGIDQLLDTRQGAEIDKHNFDVQVKSKRDTTSYNGFGYYILYSFSK